MYAKFSKYDFWLEYVIFLGIVVSKDGIIVDSTKIKAISDWARPISLSRVRNFIKLARYYRQFIKRFANIAAPMARLSKNEVSFQ